MPTRDEVLRKILKQQEEILGRLDRMDQAEGGDPWLKDFDLDGETGPQAEHPDPAVAELRDSTPAPTATAIVLPDDWGEMNEEQRAAWARVVAEGGQPGPEDFLAEPETVTIEMAGGVGAEFPTPDDRAVAKWEQTAALICENYAPSPDSGASGTPEQMTEWYKVGGPLWLAAYDHEYLMGLPPEMRAVMVQTVLWYAPIEAQLLGRDILRADTETAKDYALGAVLDQKAKKR